MRNIHLCTLFLILSGCMGEQFQMKVDKKQDNLDETSIINSSKVKQREFKPNHIKIEASGNSVVKIQTPNKPEEYSSENKGDLGSKSSLSYSFEGVKSFLSSWYYLILAVSFILFLIGFKVVKGYLDQLGISGGLKLGVSWLSELGNMRKQTTNKEENAVLNELESRLERKLGKLKQKSRRLS